MDFFVFVCLLFRFMDAGQDGWFVVLDVGLKLCDGACVKEVFQIAGEILISELIRNLVFNVKRC